MNTTALWIAVLTVVSLGMRTHALADDEAPRLFELRDDKLELTDRALTFHSDKTASIDVVLEPPIKPPGPPGPSTRPVDGATPPRDLATVDVRLARAWFGGEPTTADASPGVEPLAAIAFRVSFEPTAPRILHVAFDVATIARPGTYKLAVDFIDKTTGERLQSISVVLARPHAQLRAIPDAIAIDLVQWWPSEVATLDKDVKITLEETANKTGAVVTAADTGAARNEGHAIAAMLTLKDGTTAAGSTLTLGRGTIEAGSTLILSVGIEGEFPPGKSAGEIEIRSQEADRLAIKYEIRTRLAGTVIALALFAGWLIGLVVRVVLVQVARRFDVVQQIAAIREEAIASGKAFSGDARAQVDRVIAACRAAEQTWFGIDAAYTRLRSEHDSLRTQLQEQLAAARLKVQAFAKAVTPSWKLAATVRDAMSTLNDALARASASLAAGDPTRAEASIDEAFANSVPSLVARIEIWRQKGLATAIQLEIAPDLAKWPESLRQLSRDTAIRWRELLGLVPSEGPSDPEALLAYVRAVHAVRVHVDAAATSLAATWRMIVEACAALTADLTPNPLAALPGSLPVLHDSEDYLAALADQAAAIIGQLRTALLALVPADHPRHKDIETWLDDGKWVSAVGLACEVAKSGPTGLMLTSTDERAEPGLVPAARAIALEPAAATPAHVPPATVATRARRFQLATVWATWVVSGLVLVAFYTVYFAARQPATWSELLGIAGQAFSIDVGVAAIATAATNLAR